MMESTAMIQASLALVGVDLVFDTGTICGISQQKLEDISDYASPYTVTKNTYSFILSVADIQLLDIVDGEPFTVIVFTRKYSFLAGTYTEDLTGFALMYVTMTGVENV